MYFSSFTENLRGFWCFDCLKIFFADGDSQIGTITCPYCGNKNYDHDMNFRYSRKKIQGSLLKNGYQDAFANQHALASQRVRNARRKA